jgi:hypothetical protein
MSISYEHYKAQAALCRAMAASASTEKLAAEWQMLANLWLGMASRGINVPETSFDLTDEAHAPQDSVASSGAHRASRAF